MIDAGERLAAERGFAAMSLREVQAAAGQRNKSAAQYHFGSREGLIEAIATARMAPINVHRRAMLDELDRRARPATIRELVEVIVVPLAEATLHRGSHWARFLAQSVTDPTLVAIVDHLFAARPYVDAVDRLVAAADHLPVELRRRRIDHAVGLLVVSLAGSEARLATRGAGDLPVAAVVGDLVDTCTAIVRAPASAATRTGLGDAATNRSA